jgi:hypothetical protein
VCAAVFALFLGDQLSKLPFFGLMRTEFLFTVRRRAAEKRDNFMRGPTLIARIRDMISRNAPE